MRGRMKNDPYVRPDDGLTPQEFAFLFKADPLEALEYLRRREKLTVTEDWQALWQEEHARQFTVSRLTNQDLLKSIRDKITALVDGNLDERMSRKNFLRLMEDELIKAGWWGEVTITGGDGEQRTTVFNERRLKLILDTNTRMAFAAGQWERMWRNRRTHPYIRYVTLGDHKVRPEHRAWHNLVLPVEHPFWHTHLPPNGWGCRCRVVSVSQREYDEGLSPHGTPLKKEAPDVVMRDWIDRTTGEIRQVPLGIDPGFAYNPGMAAMREAALEDLARRKGLA